MCNRNNKSTKKTWKEKAVSRNKTIRRQKKRIAELTKSRDKWKLKYTNLKRQIFSKSVFVADNLFTSKGKPRHYAYGNLLILLTVNIMSYSGSSLRSCKHFLTQLFIIFELNTSVPCHSTIRMWVCKTGHYTYHSVKDEHSDWVLIIDESQNLGESKAFVVLGLALNEWKFTNPISHSDVELLHFEVVSESKKEYVSKVLEDLRTKYKVKYVLSDRGNNFLGAYNLSKITHISDCTHVLAKALEKYFKQNTLASEFLSMSGKLRQKWNMGKKTIYIPPSQRKKARFQNLSPLIKWGEKIQNIWGNIPKEIKTQLNWFEKNVSNFEELKVLNKTINFINKVLKVNGYTSKTANQIVQYMSSLPTLSQYGEGFKEEISTYLSSLKKSAEDLGGKLVCCSDIIESLFGKLKYSMSTNSSFGMTEFSFALASIGNKNSAENIKKAMENTSENQIERWKKENISPSLFQKKRKLFEGGKVGEEILTN